MDSIEVTGIKAYGYTGYLPEETVLGQWFEVDLTIGVDLSISGESDRIEDTFDYRRAIAIVKHHIENDQFALIERLAHVIAAEILSLEKVQQVRVKLAKLNAPIAHFSGRVTIDISRQ